MTREKEDRILRDLIQSSAVPSNLPDEPTIISLQDTIDLLARKKADWRNDEFYVKILVWQASLYLENHVEEILKDYPEILSLCIEYKTTKTIYGQPLEYGFTTKLFQEFFKPTILSLQDTFESSPVREAYFKPGKTYLKG